MRWKCIDFTEEFISERDWVPDVCFFWKEERALTTRPVQLRKSCRAVCGLGLKASERLPWVIKSVHGIMLLAVNLVLEVKSVFSAGERSRLGRSLKNCH